MNYSKVNEFSHSEHKKRIPIGHDRLNYLTSSKRCEVNAMVALSRDEFENSQIRYAFWSK